MLELTIHGRGGQGGVTLAKLIATAFFRRGKYAQAFGVYAAERSGAPLQAYVRIDDAEITNHNQIRQPDHVIVLDRTLTAPGILNGLDPGGWLLMNAGQLAGDQEALFAGRTVGLIDATAIAVNNGLGSRAVPIVNTTMFGAAGRLLDILWEDVAATLHELKFSAANLTAARAAFDSVQVVRCPGDAGAGRAGPPPARVAGLLDPDTGERPRIRTGSWATRQPRRHGLTPPCNHRCPAGNDVQAFVNAAADHDYTKALGILLETSPFPGVCGRVCPAPCVEECNRRHFDEAVNVRELERYVADHGRRPAPTGPFRHEPISVIGAGPAGLSATYHLARLGYPVSLFEAGDELGGVMRSGIPEYRLPAQVLDAEIGYVIEHGVTVWKGRKLGREDLLRMSHGFAAVFVATGLQESRAMRLEGAAPDAVMQGLDFLEGAHRRSVWLRGQRVIVVGGGNTAVDAARSALRLGARHVRILYRRSRVEMPAIREEVDAALEEGVVLDELVLPLRVHHHDRATQVTCVRMRLGEPDAGGRRQPVPLATEDAYFDLPCDRVILALGQTADLSILPEGAEIRDGDRLLGLCGAPLVIGGDFATNEGTVAAAIGSGRRAAWHIHKTLTGEDLFPAPEVPVAAPEDIKFHLFRSVPRQGTIALPRELRRRSFLEVHRGFADGAGCAAPAEAARCLSCGVCNQCDRCVQHCPEGIVLRNGDGYAFDYDYCKGCGVCASECPRGVIFMSEL